MLEMTHRGTDGCPLHAWVLESAPRSAGIPVVLLHGGGPDHHSMVPLARYLAENRTILLPDIRGYGRSVCADPACHTWRQYAEDVVALLEHVGAETGVIVGAGIGATIALRTAVAHPSRVASLVLISVEDIEDDAKKKAEIAFMDAFAARVVAGGLEAAWGPVLPDLAPVIGAMVREAMPRSDPASIAAAAAIGRDRSFRSAEELAVIAVPALLIPGMDARHPAALAEMLARLLPKGQLAAVDVTAQLRTAEDLARAFAPAIREFLDGQ